MNISIIAAISSNGIIGKDGGLPWRLPDDMNRFKTLTTGKPVIMGRKTWESLPAPLANRHNIVISKSYKWHSSGMILADSLDHALYIAGEAKEVMIIGGSKVYEKALKIADKIYLTVIHEHIEGDTYFPEITDDWKILGGVYRSKTETNPHNYSFLELVKF